MRKSEGSGRAGRGRRAGASHKRERRLEVLVLGDLGDAYRLDLGRERSPAATMMALVRGGLERVTPRGLPEGLGLYVHDDFLSDERCYDNAPASALAARQGLTIFGTAIVVRERGSGMVSLSAEDLAHLAARLGTPLPPRARRPSRRLLAPRKHLTPEELDNVRAARWLARAGDDLRCGSTSTQLVFDFSRDDDIPF